jgi:hypothetical protein
LVIEVTVEKTDLEKLAELSRDISDTQRAVAELWQGVADRLEAEAPIDEVLQNLLAAEGELAMLADKRRGWGNRVDVFLALDKLSLESPDGARVQT